MHNAENRIVKKNRTETETSDFWTQNTRKTIFIYRMGTNGLLINYLQHT